MRGTKHENPNLQLPNSSNGFFIVTLASNMLGQDAAWKWAKRIGGIGDEQARKTAVDVCGNIYVTGWFSSSTLTIGSTMLTNAGGRDAFIAKYDPSGNVMWAKSIGAEGDELPRGITAQGQGNVYVTGIFTSSSVAIGSANLANSGIQSGFTARMDAQGNVIWATGIGGSGSLYTFSCVTDSSGICHVVGRFSPNDTVRIGSTSLISTVGERAFLATYDSLGNALWARGFGESGSIAATDVAVDGSGNTYLGGYFYSDTLAIDTITLVQSGIHTGGGDAYIAEYDQNGNVKSARIFGGSGNISAWGITADGFGNSYVAGSFDDKLTVGSTTLTTAGLTDAFVIKLDQKLNLNPSLLLGSVPDSLQSQSTYQINWEAGSIDRIDISYSTNSGLTWAVVAANVDASIGTYSWQVPLIVPMSSLCRLRISSMTGATASHESRLFTIYAKLATPSFSPTEGAYDKPPVVTISSTIDSVNIYYSLDGSEPTDHSTPYASPILIDTTGISKAKAYKTGWVASDVCERKDEKILAASLRGLIILDPATGIVSRPLPQVDVSEILCPIHIGR